MKNQWRLLLLRNVSKFSFQNPTSSLQAPKVYRNFTLFSSFTSRNVHSNALDSELRTPTSPRFPSPSHLEQNKLIDGVVLNDILSKSSSNEEIKTGLESNGLSMNPKVVLGVLRKLEKSPDIALKFFNFVSETNSESLSPKSCDLMLAMLGRKDYANQVVGLMDIMKKKGYRVAKPTYLKVLENLKKEEMVDVVDRLKELYGSPANESFMERLCSRVCNIIRRNEWGEDVELKLRDLNCSWSNDLVAMAIGYLSSHPIKAFMLFRWVEEDPSFKHNELSYNAMIKVLGRENYIEKFWKIVEEMKEADYQMDMETYVSVMERFYKKKMVKDGVDLYERMMGGAVKPSVEDSVVLLQKVVVSKELDMELFSRALKIFTDGGNSLTKGIFDSVVHSLITAGRMHECGRILKAVEKAGFQPTNEVYNKIIFRLSSAGRSDEAIQLMDEMEASGYIPDFNTWSSLIHGQCLAHDLEKASSSFRSMIEKVGVADAGYAFEVLVNGFCRKKRARDAYKLLTEMVEENELKPSDATYKMLIRKLLVQRAFDEALSLLKLIKSNNYPSYQELFVSHISRHRSGTDAMMFLRAVTDGESPSTSTFISMFQEFFKAGRYDEAQNCFSMCPDYIQTDADVLNLFHEQTSKDADASVVGA